MQIDSRSRREGCRSRGHAAIRGKLAFRRCPRPLSRPQNTRLERPPRVAAAALRGRNGKAAAVDDERRPLPSVAVRGAKRWRIDARPLRAAVLATLASAAPHVVGEVAVVLTGDKDIRRLNKRYRDKDAATDVLSFDVDDGLTAGEPFGDVVVSVETARRQARAYRAPLMEEMQRLIVHGTLHLCGYDHHERREAARMHALTRRLLRDLRAEDDHL